MQERESSWVWADCAWRAATLEGTAVASIVQVSDLHLGQAGRDYERAFDRLCEELAELEVDAIVLTGDVAHVPEDTAAFSLVSEGLDRLSAPAFVIPGNHDIRAPYPAESCFDHYFGPTPRVERLEKIELILLDTFRPLVVEERSPEDRERGRDGHFAHGAVTASQLENVADDLDAQPDRPRVVAVHHHLHQHRPETGREEPTAADIEQMRPLYDAEHFLDWCELWRVDLVLSGHQHAWTPPEAFRGIPNVRGTKTLASHGVARLITFTESREIHVVDHEK